MKGQVSQKVWVLILMLLAGIVLGGFIGEYVGKIPNLSWLGYGRDFGFTSPVTLDAGVIKLQFGLTLHFTIAGILGMVAAAFIYRKIG